ncbi:hypothetical protein ACRRTK_015562 [Alexandromys fortis]
MSSPDSPVFMALVQNPPLSVVAVERPQPRGSRAFSGGLGGVSGGHPAWLSALGRVLGGEGPPFGETGSVSARKSLETLKHRTPGSAATCSGSGKNLSCLPLRAHSCRADPRDAPQVQDGGPYRPALRGLAIPATGDRERSPLCLSLAGLDGEKSGLQGILALGCFLFPAERAAVSWSVGGYRRQPLERLWLQPPPPLVGAGSGGGSHPGVTAPRPLPPRQGRSIKACWRPALRIPPVALISHGGAHSRAPAAQRRQPASHGECQDPLGQERGLSDAPELAQRPVLCQLHTQPFLAAKFHLPTLIQLSTCPFPGPLLAGRPTSVPVIF